MFFCKKYFPHFLLVINCLLFIICAIHPYNRAVRFTENLPVMVVVLFLVYTFNKRNFSNSSYFLMNFWIILHTIGGHYTFELVPFDSINQLFGWERNMYDRIAHFMIGVYAFPIMEYLWRSKAIQQKWLLYTFGICSILTIAAAYEIFEWRFAIIADPKAGLAVLGSQGDIRDAQKDMLMDTLGALLAVFLFIIREKFINKRKAD